MDTGIGTLLAKGWLENIGVPDSNGAVPLVIRSGEDLCTVWVEFPEAGVIPPLQSIVTVRSREPQNGACGRTNELEVLHTGVPLPVATTAAPTHDLDKRHLYVRMPQLRATAKFRHFIQKYAREFLEAQGCINVHTPVLVEATCVCSGDVFTFPYYGKRIATLVQSPWMYADVMTAGADRVYALNPSFRRERVATNIHLVEIWQLQVDMAWMTNTEILDTEEGLVRHVAHLLQTKHGDLYEQAGLSAAHLTALKEPFARITYDESLQLLAGQGVHLEYGSDYTQQQSDQLSALFDRPYFITRFPKRLKNFWFPSCPDDANLTPSNDLFAHTGHGELIGGGTRVTDPEELKRNLAYYRHDLDEFKWFLETREYGCVPHAGFSVGFDRLTAFMMGVHDIRDATLFPRVPRGPLVP